MSEPVKVQQNQGMAEAVASAVKMFGMVPAADSEAEHIGSDDLPFVVTGEGVRIQLLYVDMNAGTWIARVRFEPGTTIDTHYHTGHIFAFTVAGKWFYTEYPDVVNGPGSFLFEPAHSIHTLTIPPDQKGETDVWFVLHGTNINIDSAGSITSLTDGKGVLQYYRALCAEQGVATDKLVVKGE